MHFLKYFYTRVYTNYPPLKEYIIEILTKFCKQSLSRLLFQSIIKLSRNVNSRKTVSKRKRTKSRYSIAYIHRACITDTFPPFERYTQRSEHVERGEVRGHNKRIPSPVFRVAENLSLLLKKKKKSYEKRYVEWFDDSRVSSFLFPRPRIFFSFIHLDRNLTGSSR